MTMSSIFPVSGHLLAAQAGTHAKGQDTLQAQSQDKAETLRLARQRVITRANQAEQARKTTRGEKSILA